MSEAAVVTPASRREIVWAPVDWEALRRSRIRFADALPVLRRVGNDASRSAPLTLTLSRRERELSGCANASLGGGALSLRERVGVRGESAVEAFASAVGASPMEAVVAAARDLAGLGEGSTPAGDDFLVGAMYALRWLLPEARAERLCEAIAKAAAPRTSSLSAQWLHRAAGGEAIPTWSFFLSALAAGETSRMRACARDVLALGHTSGRAALDGFIATAAALIGDPA